MAESPPNLRLLDTSDAARELDLASELFHRINRVIPQNQSLLTVPPKHRARDAIAQMSEYGYSQVPVVDNDKVLGVFSYRSFAHVAATMKLEELNQDRCSPGDLPVDEFLEQFEFARVTAEMSHVFDFMDRDNGVLIGTAERLVGVLTPMDFLRYLHEVASPFVLVSEIELALRELIRIALTPEQIVVAAERCLVPRDGTVPTSLEEMSFENYRSLLSNGDTWKEFEPVFGSTRNRTSAKLKEVGAIRNDLFHFKRDPTVQDHQTLASRRNWLLIKIKQVEARHRAGKQP